MAELVRHRQTKESATDRLHLNHRATPRLHTRAVPGRHCSDYRVNEARPFGLMITVDRAVDLADTRSSQRVAQKGGLMKLTAKKALITGGNSGIGLATARLFIAEGAQVAITGRDPETLDEAIAELGSSARGYRADVTIAEERKRLFEALAKDFGKLDIVFANAGITGRTPTGSTDEAIFENVIHTNLSAAFFTVNSAAPLLNDNGSIIFSGSVQNYLGQPGVAAYAATKGGLVSMARCIAADLAPRNIRVNVVAPGAIKTPIWKRGP